MIPFDPALHKLVFRPVLTATEMRSSLCVRASVYAGTPGLRNLDSIDFLTGLDLDEFDSRADHLGLFVRGEAEDQLVGTLRIVTDQRSPQLELLRVAVNESAHLLRRLVRAPSAPLPMLTYLTQAAAVRRAISLGCRRGERVAEPGRLAVLPQARRALARAGISPGQAMVVSALAFGFHVRKLDRVFLDCAPHLRPLYEAGGFEPLAGMHVLDQASLGVALLVMSATLDSVPVHMQGQILAMAEEFRSTGEILVHAALATPKEPVFEVARGPVGSRFEFTLPHSA